jgi:branched-chain amino acid transport system permease protein
LTEKPFGGIGWAIDIMKHLRTLALLAILTLFAVLPILIGWDPTITSICVITLLSASAAVAWNIFSGTTGYISLGHAAYYGVGAYTLAILCQDLHIQRGSVIFLLMPLCGLSAGLVALPLGMVTLRTHKHTFTVITIAIFFIFQRLAYNVEGITGGSRGIYLPSPDWSMAFFDLPFYYVSLTLLVLVTLTAWWIRSSKYGLGLLAIRDDEDRAQGLGVRTGQHKLGAYTISASLIGIVGAVQVYYGGLINPEIGFNPSVNISIALIAMLGGMGTLMGPIIGSLVILPLQAFLTIQAASLPTGLDLILFGGLLLAVILVLPDGAVPFLHERSQHRMAARDRAQDQGSLSLVLQAPELLLPDLGSDSTSTTGGGALRKSNFNEQQHGHEKGARQYRHKDPRRPTHASVPMLPTSTQKVRAYHLVSMGGDTPATSPEQSTIAPHVNWRCPRCKIPFLLSGTTCFCPRCGFTRLMAQDTLPTPTAHTP